MVNDLYLSVVYRPVAGTAPSLVSRLVSKHAPQALAAERADALEASEKLAQTVASSLARYEPERLAAYYAGSGQRPYSQVLEFFGLLLNGEWQAVPLPRAPLHEVLATTRVIFGSETIEYRLPTHTRFGAMLGIKEYATPTTVGMFDALLSAPFEFVLTQSFAFLSKGTGQGLLQRQYNQMSNAGDFAVSQAEELKDALDALTANEFVMGDHHFTLQVLTSVDSRRGEGPDSRRLRKLNDDVALARSMLADTGMTTAREDLALEAAYWAQLPGCFSHAAAQGADHVAELLREGGLSQLSQSGGRRAITGATRWHSSSRARVRRTTSRCTRVTRVIRTVAAARTPGTPSSADRPAAASRC